MLELQQLVVDPDQYSLSVLSYLHLAGLVIFIVLGALVPLIERFTWFSRVFLVFCLAGAFWQAARYGLVSAQAPSVQQYYAALGYSATLVLVVSLFHLCLNGLQKHHNYAALLTFCWVAAVIGAPLILTTPWFVSGVRLHEWGYEPRLGAMGYMLVFCILSLAVVLFREVISDALADRRAKTYRVRRATMVYASFLLVPATADLWLGMGFPVWPMSTPFVLTFALVVAVMTIRFRWMDVNADVNGVSLLSKSHLPSLILDSDGVIQYANANAESILAGKGERLARGIPIDVVLGVKANVGNLHLMAQSGQLVEFPKECFFDGRGYRLSVSYIDDRRLSFHAQLLAREGQQLMPRFQQSGSHVSSRRAFVGECKAQLRLQKAPLAILMVAYRQLQELVLDKGLREAELFQEGLQTRVEKLFADALVIGNVEQAIVVLAEAEMFRDSRELERRVSRLAPEGNYAGSIYAAIGASLVLNVVSRELGQIMDQLYKDVFSEKYSGVVQFCALNQGVSDRINEASKVAKAIHSDQFEYFLQPIVDADTREIRGFEALVRWRHEDGSYIRPDSFVHHIEVGPLALQFELWSVKTARRLLKQFNENGRSDLWLSINLSTLDLHVSGIVEILDVEFSEDMHLLERLSVEITERCAMSTENEAILLQLQRRGVQIAIDDFGIDQSSLSRLVALPLDKLKIDRSFVRQIQHRPAARAIVKHIKSLAEDLGLDVIAEGVELEQEEKILRDFGISLLQGYYYSKAKPVDHWVQSLFNIEDSRRDGGSIVG